MKVKIGFSCEDESAHSTLQIAEWISKIEVNGKEKDEVERCRKKQDRLDGYMAGQGNAGQYKIRQSVAFFL